MTPENQETGTNPPPKKRVKAKRHPNLPSTHPANRGPKSRRVPSKAVAIHKPTPTAPDPIDYQILLAAADPAVDVAKMKALTDLRRQLRIEAAEEEFNLAMSAAQMEMRPIEADAQNPQTHSKYTTLYGVDKALRPIYSKHGLNISFNTADCPKPEHMRVLTYVSRGLYTREYQFDVPVDTKGPKGNDVMTKTHAGGSALSYGKRYSLLMIFNVTIGKDDDGNRAGGKATITEMQAKELIALLDDAGGDKAKFCAAFGVDGIALLLAKDFDDAKQRIATYKAKKTQAQSDFPGDR